MWGLQSSRRHVRSLVPACGNLVPWPEIKPRPPALGVWRLSHWSPREVPRARCPPFRGGTWPPQRRLCSQCCLSAQSVSTRHMCYTHAWVLAVTGHSLPARAHTLRPYHQVIGRPQTSQRQNQQFSTCGLRRSEGSKLLSRWPWNCIAVSPLIISWAHSGVF